MAEDLCINKAWFHKGRNGKNAHYDIPIKRKKEIMDKCQIVTNRRILEIIKT